MLETQTPSEVAADAVASGDDVALPTMTGLIDGMAATVLRGTAMAKAGVVLGAESVRIALGRSDVAPLRGDWRFKDPAWSSNPVYRRIGQLYLAWCAAVDALLDDVEQTTDLHRAERARFVMNILTSAVSPTNTLLGNPAAVKKTFEAGGANLVRGVEHFVSDLRHLGGIPSMAKPGALTVGEDLALTPGQVIDKDEYAELLQYAPFDRHRAPAARLSRAAPHRPLLLPRPSSRPQLRGVRHESRSSDFHALLAEPISGAVALEYRHLRPKDPGRRRHRTRSDRRPGRERDRILCRRDPADRGAQQSRRDR